MYPSRGSGGPSGPTRVHQPCGPRLPETRTWVLPTQGLAFPHLTQLPSSSSTPSTSLPHGRGLVDTDKSRTDSFGRPEAFRVLAVAGRGGGTGALSPHHRPLVPRMERGVQSPRGGPRSPLLPLKPRPAPSPVSNINRSSLKQGLLFNPK